MSARNLKFPIAVGYKKQQFDPALQLERMPDISKQAAQPFKEEAAALQTQYQLDETLSDFKNFVANNLEANKEKELNFLSQLAPFSGLIKQQISDYEDRWDARRQKTADELAGKVILDGRQSPEFNNITGTVNDMASRVKEHNLGVIKDIQKLDYASQAYAFESLIKSEVKGYKDNFQNWRNTVGPIDLGGGVTINPQVISTDAEAKTLIDYYEDQKREALSAAGVSPDVYESYRRQSGKARANAYNDLLSQNRELEGEEITAQRLAALSGGASYLNMEKAIANAPKNNKRKIGYAEARTKILSHAVEGIKNFVYNYKDIERWKNEVHPITGKPLKEDPRYNSFFGRLERALNERKNADATDLEDRNKKAFNLYSRQLLGQVKRGEIRVSEKLVNDWEAEVFEKFGIVNPPIFKFLREGLTVDDKKAEKLEKVLKKTLDSGGYMPEQELLRFGQDLYDKYQNQNALNKKFYVDSPEIKELNTQVEAYANAPAATPGGGLGLQWDPAKKPTLGQVRILAEAKRLAQENFRAISEQAGPDGTVNGKSVVDLAREKTILQLEELKKNPESIFYFNEKKGEYTNVRRVSSNYGTSYTQAPTSIENMQLSRDSITALQDVARDNNTQYGAIISDENLLSQVISKEQAQQMKAQLENGRGVHPVIAGLALALGAQQVPTAAAIFNTHGLGSIEVKGAYERIAGQLADPNLQENVTLEDLMRGLNNPEAGPLQKRREANQALGEVSQAEDGIKKVVWKGEVLGIQGASPEERAAIRLIYWAEGTYKPEEIGWTPDKMYGMHFGGSYTPPGGNHPDKVTGSPGLRSAAYGAGQFMPGTWRTQTSFGRQGLPMTPENQDKATLELIRGRKVDPTRELTATDFDRLAPEWASIPDSKLGRGIYPGQKGRSPQAVYNMYQRFLREERSITKYNETYGGLI